MSDSLAIVLGIALLLLNALFVGAEFSLLSSRRDRLEALVDQGVARARTVIRANQEGSLMLTSAQLGITLCSLGLGRLGEPAVAHRLEVLVAPLRIPGPVLHAVAFTIALALVVVLHVLIGEMVPKNLAIADPERLALWLVPFLVGFVKLARPFIALFNMMANAVLRLLKVEPKDELETAYTSTELAELLVESRREGLLEQAEHRRLAQTLSSVEHVVRDVLVPLDQLTTLPGHFTLGDVEHAVSTTGFSRFPVRGQDGTLLGYLHIKDVLDKAGEEPATPVDPARVRRLPTVPADARLDEALTWLRRAGSHLATAVDATGRPLGVVALEDLVEEYVGTVRDGTHVRTAG
ncbi:CBS domain containing-hemolysin-like protein [Saccharopolyspora erythraea NRRL 2338]|uniref:CBS domain protein n=2 Tax=Saccharopolyspora erythraea TaxID=1836 RepID=A4FGC9_SACEN|nr:hemolysin family protein [Saccharopolyspora erythraea]EQD84880.1 membrane protein [Saccharopolyspora erythraea D]PFG96808.1 CBS domain containing-hemolysin-like protein [Saccharopolyspora erythraea NRRL 2338]QRK87049.1 HlyC/CorC family transporter [Saccharopolyspora erythraea]CAM03104.1 CBS domain protein [Saccharopolyspora erythraea NRRL 2338]